MFSIIWSLIKTNIKMMKTKMMIVAVVFGLMAISCGGETADVQENENVQQELNQAETEKIEELNKEIEAIEAADAEIDEVMNELDQI